MWAWGCALRRLFAANHFVLLVPAADAGSRVALADGVPSSQIAEAAELVGVGDLAVVIGELAARVLGVEAEHQGVGEGPGLAAQVAQGAKAHPHLLVHLAMHRLLHRLAGLHEARQCAEPPLGSTGCSGWM